jgi:hypothetical protein
MMGQVYVKTIGVFIIIRIYTVSMVVLMVNAAIAHRTARIRSAGMMDVVEFVGVVIVCLLITV